MKRPAVFNDIMCVTFDLDDTLWPVAPTIIRAEQVVYAWITRCYPKISNKYTADQIVIKRNQLGERRKDIAYDVTELRYVSLLELAHEFNYSENFADEALSLFRQYRNKVYPYEYSEAVLFDLHQHYMLGAITNGNAQLENIPLGRFFDFVVTAEDVGVGKPHPDMFIHASKKANVALENIVHIGDSPQTDVLGAIHAGCKAIWFNDKRQSWPGGQTPDQVVHCLSELPQLLIPPKE